MNQSDALALLARQIRSRQPLLAIVSYEEDRVMRSIASVAASISARGSGTPMTVVTWSFTQGLVGATGVDPKSTKEPGSAFEAVLKYSAQNPRTLFVFRDLHGFLGTSARGFSPILVRYLRDLSAAFETAKCTAILLDPVLDLPDDLKKGLPVLDWPLPTTEDLEAILLSAESSVDPALVPLKLNGDRGLVVDALRGFTEFEARSALAAAMVQCRELSSAVIPILVREKAQAIRRGGLLEYYDRTVTMTDVGGLAGLKAYARNKRAAMSPQARADGLDSPRGVILVGVPGTGKSLAAKAFAGGTLPLIRMDVGALMGGLVGQSEGNTRRALAQVDAVSPCILWLDEIEKALGGMGGGENDGGTRMRVFGTILTWMQERDSEVFVVATANDISSLAPELVRRFNDVIFVDLPGLAERIEIAQVHLLKRKRNPADFDLQAFAAATWSFSGAEIEKVISSALEEAFVSGVKLSTAGLVEAAAGMRPIASIMPDRIAAVRTWALNAQAKRANEGLEPEPGSIAISLQNRTLEF